MLYSRITNTLQHYNSIDIMQNNVVIIVINNKKNEQLLLK